MNTGRTFPTSVAAPVLLESLKITGRVRPALVIHRFQALLALLQLPVRTIYKQRSMGQFCPAYKIGRHLRWKRGELMDWIETKRDAV